MFDLILKSGMIVSPETICKADIAVKGGTIAAIAGAGVLNDAGRVIDVAGKYVLPGVIDPHCHILAPFSGCIGALDFYEASIAGAFGGVTTIIDFSNSKKGKSVLQAVKERREEMKDCVCDYGVHAKFVEANEQVLGEIKELVALGCPTIKMFMTYKKEGVCIDDEGILAVMKEAVKWGAMPGVHAENNAIAETNVAQFQKEGKLDWKYFPESKPNLCEAEAVQRAIFYANYTGSPLYVFHLSTEEGLLAIEEAQEKGLPVKTETCPHYLTMTKEKYLQDNGHLYIMSPPLREQKDVDALWSGIATGAISVIGSDNCTYSVQEKEMFLKRNADGSVVRDFTKVVNGVVGLEERLMLLIGQGVNQGRLSVNQLCAITSSNPAKIFGMYPKKGVIQVGSDADMVVVDPEKCGTLSHVGLHQKIDYSIYEGFKAKGWPIMTIRRGEVLVENGQFVGKKGTGRFIARKLR
jgi:dihydropyrimidinase